MQSYWMLFLIPLVPAYSYSSRNRDRRLWRVNGSYGPQSSRYYCYSSPARGGLHRRWFSSPSSPSPPPASSSSSSISKSDPAALDALERTAAHLKKLQRRQQQHEQRRQPTFQQHPPQQLMTHTAGVVETSPSLPTDSKSSERERLYQIYIKRPANSLKVELEKRSLPTMGRKPDLAARLAKADLRASHLYDSAGEDETDRDVETNLDGSWPSQEKTDSLSRHESVRPSPVRYFAGMKLSVVAAQALGMAQFIQPSPIQAVTIPRLNRGESLIVHAETGSGKTLAYLLPITERQWRWHDTRHSHSSDAATHFTVIMTPTRELAAQVAGVAAALAPPGSVRLIARPTNLMSNGVRERSGGGGATDDDVMPQIFIGSATALMHSLYGDGVMPAAPTSKPEAMHFLRSTRTIVLDEVDRMLSVRKSHADRHKMVHEKPAAIVCAAVARLTLGKAQVVAVSATVGRPLKRELARVLGLPPQECPPLVQVTSTDAVGEELRERSRSESTSNHQHVGRAVTVPSSVQHYVLSIDSSSPGHVLTAAYQVIESLNSAQTPRRILLVLTRGFGINTQNAIGALRHFQCRPPPRSLLDALQADGTDALIEVHQKVSGSLGVGESARDGSSSSQSSTASGDNGYLFVTGEDTVRGLHLDGLDLVIIAGRPNGPDEYIHIAGRTGRAGRTGQVINIVGGTQEAAALVSWETMLQLKFHPWRVVG